MEPEALIREGIRDIKPYVPGKPIEEVQRELGLEDVVKLASNENPLGPSPLAIKAIQAEAAEVNLYPDGACFELRRALAQHLGVSEQSLILGNGADEIIKLLAEAFLRPGEEVLVGRPSFSEYDFCTQLMGGKVIPVSVDAQFCFDLPAMAQRIGNNTKLVFICNPNNPTGTIVKREELVRFLDQVPPEVLVILDEAYGEFADDPDYPQGLKLLSRYPNLVVLRTFSKVYGLAGLRVGYGVGSPEVISWIHRVREPFNVNRLAQKAALAALADAAHVERTLENNRLGKEYLYRELARLGLAYLPTQANFIFVNVGRDCRQVFQALLKEGVITRTGDIFGLDNFLRISIGRPEENQKLIRSLEKVLPQIS